MVVGLTTVKEAAAVPPKLTDEMLIKLVPVMVITPDCPELVGVNEVTVGVGGMYVKPARTSNPSGLVTATDPDAPEATTAVMVVPFTTVNDVAATPPKFTAVAVVKFVPVMVMVAPVAPLVGVNEVTVGAVAGGINVKPVKVSDETGVTTFTAPDDPTPTTAVMVLSFTTVKLAAGEPPKLTAVAPVKLFPEMVTVFPVVSLVGAKDEIVGGSPNATLSIQYSAALSPP